MAIEIVRTSVRRNIRVGAELSERSDQPPDIPKLYARALTIRPRIVWADLTFDEETRRWVADRFSKPFVVGPRVLSGGRLSQTTHDTSVSREAAPWVFEWVDDILATLNASETADLPESLMII